MASLVAGTLCRQARSIGRLHTVNQNHFTSQSSLIQLCLRNFASKKMGLPRVFFDMAVDNEPTGRFVVEVSVYQLKINSILSAKNYFSCGPNQLHNHPNESEQIKISGEKKVKFISLLLLLLQHIISFTLIKRVLGVILKSHHIFFIDLKVIPALISYSFSFFSSQSQK